MKKHSRTIFLILTLAMMVFIFVHSAMPADLSGAESGPLARLLAGFFGAADDPAALELADLIVRKTAHFLEFLALGLCLIMTLRSRENRREGNVSSAGLRQGSGRVMARLGIVRLGGIAWLIGAAYAVTDEIHQIFVPGRSGQITDVLLDAAGVLAGVVIAAAAARRDA